MKQHRSVATSGEAKPKSRFGSAILITANEPDRFGRGRRAIIPKAICHLRTRCDVSHGRCARGTPKTYAAPTLGGASVLEASRSLPGPILHALPPTRCAGLSAAAS